MTPYVLAEGDEAEAEALRRKQALSDVKPWDDHGWSASKLADPQSVKEKLRKQKEQWKKLDQEHAAEIELEKAKLDRVLKLKARDLEEAKKQAEEAKKHLSRIKELQKKREEMEVEAAEALKQNQEETKVEETKAENHE